jgi:hypothetical protein
MRDSQVKEQRPTNNEGTKFGLAANDKTTNESTDGNVTELCYISSF